MPPLALLAVKIAFAFAALSVAASAVAPHLRRTERTRALQALLWVHVGRFVPLAILAPGQSDPAIPRAVLRTIAWGDFASALLALCAIVSLRARGQRAAAWVWLFFLVGSVDIVVALAVGLGFGVYEHALGVGWYVLSVYVPLVCVAQAMLGVALVRPRAFGRLA